MIELLSQMVKYRRKSKALLAPLYLRIDAELKYKFMVEARKRNMTQAQLMEEVLSAVFAAEPKGTPTE